MSGKSVNRYSPVPPIPPKPPTSEEKVSSKIERRLSQSSDLNISGTAAVVNKPPVTKHQTPVPVRTSATGSREKHGSQADREENCSQVKAQCSEKSQKEITATTDAAAKPRLVQSQKLTEGQDASTSVNDNNDEDKKEEEENSQSDDAESCTSVSFISPLFTAVI